MIFDDIDLLKELKDKILKFHPDLCLPMFKAWHDDDGVVRMTLHNMVYCEGMVTKGTGPNFVKLRRGSGKDRQGMAPKAKGLKA